MNDLQSTVPGPLEDDWHSKIEKWNKETGDVEKLLDPKLLADAEMNLRVIDSKFQSSQSRPICVPDRRMDDLVLAWQSSKLNQSDIHTTVIGRIDNDAHEKKDAEIVSLKADLKEKEMDLEDLKKEKDAEITTLSVQVDELKGQLSDLTKDTNQEIDKLTNETIRLTRTNKRLQDNYRGVEKSITELTDENDQLTNENDQLKEQLETGKPKVDVVDKATYIDSDVLLKQL